MMPNMSNDAPGKFITAPTMERSRRCENCIHWDNGPKAKQHYEVCRLGEARAQAIRTIEREGTLTEQLIPKPKRLGADDPAFAQFAKNFAMGDSYLAAGLLGICIKGVPDGDFVHGHYLCDQWSGRFTPDGAEKGDMTADEAREKRKID